VPEIEGLAALDYLTSDTLWEIREAPRRLLVVGAGPIGCELAQAFARLGSKVTLITHAARLLPREDDEVDELLRGRFEALGMEVLTDCEPLAFRRDGGEQCCRCRVGSAGRELRFDRVLLAVGRTPNTEGLGLEELGVRTTRQGTLEVDDYLATAVPTVYACGDVAGPYQFTHMASHQAWYAAVNCLFGRLRRFRVDYSVVPWATFTDPEVARVGLNRRDAAEQGIAVEVTRYDLDQLDRAIADGEAGGFLEVLTPPGSDRILGATIVGYHAAELLTPLVLAMRQGIGLGKILGTIHVYPTLGEAEKMVAGNWRRRHAPERLLRLVERYHRWRRG
jgi:pyruvate/2-oxoglutarate dehydrogenase complex dihydrolipoamide dehydrogenase (E3) component